MERMQFKSFVFPHNPASVSVEAPGRYAVLLCPGQGERTQELGRGLRRVTCSGALLAGTPGEAAALLADFAARALTPGPGLLVLPGLGSLTALLAGFTYRAEGTGAHIPYELRFVEWEGTP